MILSILPQMPNVFNLATKPFLHAVSKALEKSAKSNIIFYFYGTTPEHEK